MSNLPPKAPYKQVIVIRKDLKMKPGKIAAQAAHASVAALFQQYSLKMNDVTGLVTLLMDKAFFEWFQGSFKKVCVYVNSEAELQAIYDRAITKKLKASIITDRGDTVFKGIPTKTAVAIGPAANIDINEITGELSLL